MKIMKPRPFTCSLTFDAMVTKIVFSNENGATKRRLRILKMWVFVRESLKSRDRRKGGWGSKERGIRG